MHLIYIDDSRDGSDIPGDPKCVFSALAISDDQWRDTFDQVKKYRRQIKQSDGIKISKELHATDFIAGRGNLGSCIVPKSRSKLKKKAIKPRNIRDVYIGMFIIY